MRKTKSHILRLIFIGGVFLVVGLLLAHGVEAESAEDILLKKESELINLNKKIEELKAQRNRKAQEVQSYRTQVAILESQVEQLELEIEATIVSIEGKDAEIVVTEGNIAKLEGKIEEQRVVLANLLRLMHEQSEISTTEVLLGYDTFSQYVDEAEELSSLQGQMQSALGRVKKQIGELEEEREELEEERAQMEELNELRGDQQQALGQEQDKKNNLLSQSFQKQVEYSALVADAVQARNEIQSQIFVLRNSGLQISLAEAIKHASAASGKTGVRVAYLLAVLKVESNLGTNTGTGYYKTDMNPNQHETFIALMKELGRDPETTKVSAKPSYGWGGAMGPAQFIPTTWMGYKDETAKLTGHNPPDPWNLGDAFMASAAKLRRAGADAQTEESERVAAMIYFAGWDNPKFSWYADRVLAVAKEYAGG